MTASDQLCMFDPDATDAARLLEGYMRQADKLGTAADRFDLLGMPGASMERERGMEAALHAAFVMAFYLDLLEVSYE